MTLSVSTRKTAPLLGDDSQTAFPFGFKALTEADIQVTIANAAGVETVLVLNSDYTVALNANQETSPGGTVTYPYIQTPPQDPLPTELPTGSVMVISGDTDIDQPLDIPAAGNFNPAILENQLDRIGMQIQEVKEEVSRSARVAITSSDDPADLVTAINDLAAIISDLQTVAANIANVTTVASDLTEPVSEINTVAGSIGNVDTVGTNIASVNTAAANMAAIIAAPTKATEAAASAVSAAASEGNALTHAGTASNASSDAAAAQIAAEAALAQVLTAYDSFDDRYLGAKAADPVLDNDGNALVAGSLYFNSVDGVMLIYTGALWVAAYVSGVGFLAAANNLSDLGNAATARTNLGLGNMATQAKDAVDIDGGAIDGTAIGDTTRASGKFTTLDANGNVVLGDAAGDTVTVNGASWSFSAVATRILGDFSNATLASLAMFQSSTVNGTTSVSTLPNGTSTISGFKAYGASSPTNANSLELQAVGTTEVRISSVVNGSASHVPMTFYTNGSEQMRLDTGALCLGRTASYNDGSMGRPKLQWGPVSGAYVGMVSIGDVATAQGHWALRNTNGTIALIGLNGNSLIVNNASGSTLVEVAQSSVSLGGAAGAESLKAVPVASAVNRIEAYGSATGVSPSIKAGGLDVDVGLNVTTKGAGSIAFRAAEGATMLAAMSHPGGAIVNYPQLVPSTTGNSVSLQAQGADTNVGIQLAPKGSGTVLSTGGLASNSATNGVGYASGAGGTVTQATNKSTGVTLNKVCGQVTMSGAALAAAAEVAFTLTNSAIAATDVVVACIASGATAGAYNVQVDAVAAGSCRISLGNMSGGSLSEAVVINFVVIKAVAA